MSRKLACELSSKTRSRSEVYMDLGIKTFLSTAAILVLQSPAFAGDVVYAPGNCPAENLTVWVQNTTPRQQRVWTQIRNSEDMVDEQAFDLSPKGQIKIPGSQFIQEEGKGFSLKSWESQSLQVSTQCYQDEKVLLTGSTSAEIEHPLPQKALSLKFSLVNLFLKSQNAQVQFLNLTGQVLFEKEISLGKYYETTNFKFSVPTGARKLRLKAAERFHSQVQYFDGTSFKLSPGMALTPVKLDPSEQKTYFLVSTKDNRPEESFVIAIEDPAKIETAREQIRNPALEKIVVAGIELGNGGYNRAFQSQDKSPYTWSVSRVDSFADFAYIDCDGSPDLTEERLMEKLSVGGGRICFWRYRVVRELSLEEVRTGILKNTKP